MNARTRSLLITALLVATTSAWAVSNVTLVASPFQRPGVGADVVVAVSSTDLAGATSMDFAYTYDASVLTATGVFRTSLTGGCSLSSNISIPGLVQFHMAKPSALYGAGEIAWMTFHLAAGAVAGTTTPVVLASASFNNGAIPVSGLGASLTVGSAPATIAAPRNAYRAEGASVSIPITVSSLSGGSAFDLIVTFDPNVLSAVSVAKGSLASCMSITSNLQTPGIVRISLYGLCTVTGSGTLVNVTFNTVGATGSRTPLNVTRGSIDEDQVPTVLQDGLFNVCGTQDNDGDGYSVCAGDCNDVSASVHPGALELCNGIDDDCNAAVDDAVAPTSVSVIGLAQQFGDTHVTWAQVTGATGYDVVRGQLSALRGSDAHFASATDTCLADNASTNDVVDSSFPAAGDGFWYLVRPTNCGGAGSFDGAGSHQAGPRDQGINASPTSCR